jgi:hypothetical protein
MSISHMPIPNYGSFDVLIEDSKCRFPNVDPPPPEVDKLIGNLTDIYVQNAVSLLWTHDVLKHSWCDSLLRILYCGLPNLDALMCPPSPSPPRGRCWLVPFRYIAGFTSSTVADQSERNGTKKGHWPGAPPVYTARGGIRDTKVLYEPPTVMDRQTSRTGHISSTQ